MKVAAVQIRTRMGQLDDNLAHVAQLTAEAVAGGARLVALPEFFTGALAPAVEAYRVALPAADNPAIRFLRDTARQHACHIGGSMLVAEAGELYNRYYLATPEGDLHQHDKDLPTMWENCFYIGGHDDGVFETALGGIGAAVCWELIRTQTLKRMRGRVSLVMTGTHWWHMPDNWPGAATLLKRIAPLNRQMSEQAPVEFARCIGAPVLQASHCGPLRGDFYLSPFTDTRVPYATEFVGATQVVDAQGEVLARRVTTEGPGVVFADIHPGALPEPVAPTPDRFWVPDLPLFHRLYWDQQNAACTRVYRRHGRRRGLDAAHANT